MDRQSDRFSTVSTALEKCERMAAWPCLSCEARVLVVARALFGESLVIALDYMLQDTSDLNNALFGMLVGREADEENATGVEVDLMRRLEWPMPDEVDGD